MHRNRRSRSIGEGGSLDGRNSVAGVACSAASSTAGSKLSRADADQAGHAAVGSACWLLLTFAFTLPFLYDPTVLEVAGDIRATAVHVAAGASAILLLIPAIAAKPAPLSPRVPLVLVLALAMLAVSAASVACSTYPQRGIQPLKDLAALLILATAVAAVWTDQFANRMLWALTLPILFIALLGIAQYFGWTRPAIEATFPAWLTWSASVLDPLLGFYEQTYPPGTTFANRNLTASWTAMLVPLVLALILRSRTIVARISAAGLGILALILLVFCRSRASLLAVAAGLLFFLAIHWISRAKMRVNWTLILVTPAIIAALVYVARELMPVHWDALVGGFQASQLGKKLRFADDAVLGRWALNLNGLMMVRDHLLSGVGLGGFYPVYPLYHDAWMATPQDAYDMTRRPLHAHNDFLEAFVALGVPGGVLYLSVICCSVFYGLRAASSPENRNGTRTLLIATVLIVVGVNALLDFPLQLPTAPAVAAISMGALASEYLRFNRGRMWAPSLPRRRWMVLGLVACLGGAWALCLTDDWRLREAHGALKGGIVRIITTGGDLQSLKLVDSAHRSYPHDPRIVDYVGTAYTIYRGPDAVPIDEAVGRIEAAVAYDPWGPYLLGSLARKYLAIAGFAPPASRIPRQLALERATEIHRRLERVAYFSHETDTIGGTIALLRGDLCGARRLYRRALEKAPHDPTAQTGLSTAESLGRADQDSRSARCP